MAKANISIGLDDETGQPANAPDGPYTTDRTEDSRKRKPHAPGRATPQAPSRSGDEDLASGRKGPAQP